MHLKIVGGPSGASTKIFIDGKQYGRCTAIKYEVAARGLAKVTMEIFPESIEIEGEVPEPVKKVKKLRR